MILQYLRGGRHSRFLTTILFGFILLAVGGMVFMDVGGFFRSGGVGHSDIAKIGRETLTARAFDRTLGTILSRQGMSRQDAFRMGLVDQVLTNEIRDSLVRQTAERFGVRVGDRLVATQIEKLVPPPEEGMSKQQALDMALRAQGMNESDFVQMIRREMTVSVLRNALTAGGDYLPPVALRALYAFDKETRSADVLFLPDDAPGKPIPAPSEDDLKKLYEASKGIYSVPETRTLTLALLAPGTVKQKITVPDADLHAAYDSDPDRWKLPEKRTLEHSVVRDEKQAQAIADKARSGMPLKDAVKAATGKTENYNPDQAFAREDLTSDISGPVFAAKEKDVVGPLKSPLGFHVIVVSRIEPARGRSFDEVKEDLRREKIDSLVAERMSEAGNALDDRLAGGGTVEDAAKEFGMAIEKIGPVNAQGLAADGSDALKAFDADRAALMDSAFTLMDGESSPVSELSDGRYAVLHIDNVSPESVKSFDSVRADLEKRWTEREKKLANAKRAEAIFSAVYDNKKSLAAAAAEAGGGLVVKSLKKIERAGTPPEPLSPPAVARLFDAPQGQAVMAETKGGRIVAVVTGITPGVPMEPQSEKTDGKSKDPLEATAAQHGQDIAQAGYATYLDHLARDTGVRVNAQLLQTMYGGGDAQP